jgi:hypothetical protein
MPNQSVVYSDVQVSGTLTCTRFSCPTGAIGNDAVAAGVAGNYVAASKLEHQFGESVEYAGFASAVNAGQKMLHIVRGLTGEVVGIEGMFITAPSATTASFSMDLRKVTAASTGASILSAVVTFVSTDVVRTPKAGTISSADLADGDMLNLVITTTGSTANAALGFIATLTLREDPT